MGSVTRRILMVEIDGPDAETAAARLEAVLPVVVARWHDDEQVDATLAVHPVGVLPAA